MPVEQVTSVDAAGAVQVATQGELGASFGGWVSLSSFEGQSIVDIYAVDADTLWLYALDDRGGVWANEADKADAPLEAARSK